MLRLSLSHALEKWCQHTTLTPIKKSEEQKRDSNHTSSISYKFLLQWRKERPLMCSLLLSLCLSTIPYNKGFFFNNSILNTIHVISVMLNTYKTLVALSLCQHKGTSFLIPINPPIYLLYCLILCRSASVSVSTLFVSSSICMVCFLLSFFLSLLLGCFSIWVYMIKAHFNFL